jgi:hypothetical protein
LSPCHATEKSEAIALCKEMPVIPLNKVAEKKRIIGKNCAEEEERHTGSLTRKNCFETKKWRENRNRSHQSYYLFRKLLHFFESYYLFRKVIFRTGSIREIGHVLKTEVSWRTRKIPNKGRQFMLYK